MTVMPTVSAEADVPFVDDACEGIPLTCFELWDRREPLPRRVIPAHLGAGRAKGASGRRRAGRQSVGYPLLAAFFGIAARVKRRKKSNEKDSRGYDLGPVAGFLSRDGRGTWR